MSPEQTKYDPCRLFREGDIVSPCEHNGRPAWGSTPNLSQIKPIEGNYKVFRDEQHGNVIINYNYGFLTISHSHLELITPVEETAPYSVREYKDSFAVEKFGNTCSVFYKESYYANPKEAAEAERDRLNAEHRKESGK